MTSPFDTASLEALITDRPDTALERAIEAFAAPGGAAAGALEEAARWALARAEHEQDGVRQGALMSIAGAAAAAARHQRAPAVGRIGDDELVEKLDQLQGEIDQGLARSAAIERFSELGAAALSGERARWLDMRIRTSPDDTIFLWFTGAMALRSKLRASTVPDGRTK